MSIPIIPEPSKRSLISVEQVRHFILDRQAADNELDLDLAFSDDEIQHAMEFAAMSYNEIPPQVHEITPVTMPFAATFLNGIAYHLYLAKLQLCMRNDFDYTAGNSSVDLNKRRIEHLKTLLPVFKDEFTEQAKNRKLTINLEAAYRAY